MELGAQGYPIISATMLLISLGRRFPWRQSAEGTEGDSGGRTHTASGDGWTHFKTDLKEVLADPTLDYQWVAAVRK